MSRQKAFWGLLIRIGISLLCVILIIKVVDFRQSFSVLLGLSPLWFLGGVLFTLASRYILAYQNGVIFKHFGAPLPIGEIFLATLAANFYALFLPGDFGPSAIKIYRLGQKSNSFNKALLSVVAGRLVTIATVIVIGAIGLIAYHPQELKAAVIPAYGVLFIIIAGYLLTFNSLIIEKVKTWETTASSGTGAFFRVTKKGLAAVIACQTLPGGVQFRLLGSAIASFFMIVFTQYCLMRSVEIRLSLLIIIWVSSALLIIRLLPISISGIGIREGALVFMLGYFDIPSTAAVGLGMVVFVSIVIIALIGGLVELWENFFRHKKTAEQ